MGGAAVKTSDMPWRHFPIVLAINTWLFVTYANFCSWLEFLPPKMDFSLLLHHQAANFPNFMFRFLLNALPPRNFFLQIP